MICKKCGKEILDSAKFCGYCGEKTENFNAGINSDYSWINETKPQFKDNLKPDEGDLGSTLTGDNNKIKQLVEDESGVSNLEDVELKPLETNQVEYLKEPNDVKREIPNPIIEEETKNKGNKGFKIDKLEEKVEEPKKNDEKKSNDKRLKITILFLLLIIFALAGYIVYDKFIFDDKANNKIISDTIQSNNINTEKSITKEEALNIVNTKYMDLYGEKFNSMYYDAINNKENSNLQLYFTTEAITKQKTMKDYVNGIFGTTNQTIRQLKIILCDNNYIIAEGKSQTDQFSYYLVLKNVNNTWLIDMFE